MLGGKGLFENKAMNHASPVLNSVQYSKKSSSKSIVKKSSFKDFLKTRIPSLLNLSFTRSSYNPKSPSSFAYPHQKI